MEKLVSKENSDWELAKNSMKDLIELLSEERSSIDEKLEELKKDNSAGEEARVRVVVIQSSSDSPCEAMSETTR